MADNELRALVAASSTGNYAIVRNPANPAQAWDTDAGDWATYDRTDSDQQIALGSAIAAGAADEWQYADLPSGLSATVRYGFDVYDSGGELLGTGETFTGDASVLAALSAVADDATAIKAKTDHLPSAAAGSNGGLPTVDANNRIAGIQGTITTLDGLDTAQDAQHTATQNALSTIDGNVDAILEDTGTTIPGTLAGLATQASVNTIDGIVDNIYTAFELDGSVYRLTANALEQGGAVSLDPEDIDAIANAAAEAVGEGIGEDVWTYSGDRLLTAGTNIVLAKGTGITGFNDLDAAETRAALGLSAANLDTQLSNIPTVSEIEARTLPSADYAKGSATASIGEDIGTLLAVTQVTLPNQINQVGSDVLSTWEAVQGMEADVTSILDDTGTTLPSALSAIEGKVDNIDFSAVLSAIDGVQEKLDELEVDVDLGPVLEAIEGVQESIGEVQTGILTDVDQEPVDDNRIITLKPTTSRGLVGDVTRSFAVGQSPTIAVDFREDCPVNGRIVTVNSVEITAGTAGGITFGNSGRDKTQAKVRMTGVEAGAYTVRVKVTYDSGASAIGDVTIRVVE